MGNTTSTIARDLATDCASPLAKSPLNCLTSFTNSSNSTVAHFGNVAFGTFQADPDVAGIGTIISFIVPSAILFLCSFLIIVPRLVSIKPLRNIPIPRPAPEPKYKLNRFEKWIKDQYRTQPLPLSYHTRSHRDSIPQGLRYSHPPTTLGFPPSANHVPLHYHQPYQYPRYSTPIPPYTGPATPASSANTSNYQSSLKPSESNKSSTKKASMERDHAFYDILEAIMLCISDGQILLSLAFSMSFIATDNRCTTSQYHFKIGLNLWLNATTSAVLSFAMIRHYFRSFLSGIFRLVALIGSLIFSLGLPLMLQVNSGFASEITPSDYRDNSQIFLNALCFMDPSFRSVIVDDQINNQAVIGSCLTHPELSQEFISWAVTCIIWAIVILGRFGRRAIRPFREETDPSPDPDSRSRVVLMFWLFLMLVWCFAVGVFSYRTWWILNLRHWVASSPWIEDPSAETHVRTFGQFAALFSMASILLAALDQNVSRTEDEKED